MVRPLRPWSDQKFCHLWSEPCNFSVQVRPIIVRLKFFSNGRTNLDLLSPLLIKTWKDHFLKEYPKIFKGSSENEVEMDVDIDTTMRTKPPIDREEKLRKVEEKLLSKRTNERFTDCDGVMLDSNLTSTQKIIHLQKGIEDSTRRKIYYASLQGELFEKSCLRSKKVYKETLEETKFTRR